jgi:flagellar basal body rod protein FlgC
MPDGTIAYTRDGSFQVDAQGQLVTSSGLPVANGITIPQGATSVASADGVVSVTARPGRRRRWATSPWPASSTRPAWSPRQNLFVETAASGSPSRARPAPTAWARSAGLLEASNVNVVEELVTMIQTQRAYEMNSKAIQTSDQMLAKLASSEPLLRQEPRHETPAFPLCPAPGRPAVRRLAGRLRQPLAPRRWTCCPPRRQRSPPAAHGSTGLHGQPVPAGQLPPHVRRPTRAHGGRYGDDQIVENVTASQKPLHCGPPADVSGGITALPFVGSTVTDKTKLAASQAAPSNGAAPRAPTPSGLHHDAVIDVLPNGHLVVAGEKQIGVNQNVDVLRFSGTVDPRLQPGSIVNSTQVANVRVESRGRGAE